MQLQQLFPQGANKQIVPVHIAQREGMNSSGETPENSGKVLFAL
jgi:hypothetical protein